MISTGVPLGYVLGPIVLHLKWNYSGFYKSSTTSEVLFILKRNTPCVLKHPA